MKELKKMSLTNLQDSLSKEEMKQIMAGSGGGSCQEHGEGCNSNATLNCCTGLVCADYKCAYRTLI